MQYLNTTQAADFLGVKRITIHGYIKRGILKADKPAGYRDYRISVAALNKIKLNRPKTGRPKNTA